MEDIKKIQEFFSNPVKENSRRSPDFILTEPAEIKYTESFGSGIKAPGVLHHANRGAFLGAEGAYIIVLPGGTFYVDEDKEEAIRIYPIKDQSREFQLALDYTPIAPKYETWKSWVKKPKTLGEASKEEEEEDPIDIITMDVPLFIRVLEYSKEDAKTDMDLHDLAEKAIAATKQQGMLSMDDYDMLVGELKQIGMAEAEEEGYSQFLKTDDNPEGKTKGLDTATMNKILMNVIKDIQESKPGLWANIHAKRKRGEKPSHGNSKAHKDAVKAGKRINKEK